MLLIPRVKEREQISIYTFIAPTLRPNRYLSKLMTQPNIM